MAALVGACLVTISCNSMQEAFDPELKAAREKKEAQEATLATTQASQTAADFRSSSLENQIAALSQEIATLRQKAQDANRPTQVAKADELQARVSNLYTSADVAVKRQQLDDLNNEVKALQDVLGVMVK